MMLPPPADTPTGSSSLGKLPVLCLLSTVLARCLLTCSEYIYSLIHHCWHPLPPSPAAAPSHTLFHCCSYIEACESGSMFEGLLGNDMDIYVTTAANAIESSWATYCPTFYSPAGGDDVITDALMMTNGDAPAVPAAVAAVPGGWQQWVVRGLGWMQQQLGRITGAPHQESAAAAAVVSGGVKPSPQFTTCLGDLYSVAWMEDAESSDLTKETLLQQYKNVKVGPGSGGGGGGHSRQHGGGLGVASRGPGWGLRCTRSVGGGR